MYKVGVVVFLLSAFTAGAQSRKGITIVPNVSLSYTDPVDGLNNYDAWGPGTYTGRGGLAIHAGADVGYMFSNTIGVFAGVGLHTSGFFYMGQYLNREQYQLSLNQPVYLRLVTSKYGKVGLALNAGLASSYVLTATAVDKYHTDRVESYDNVSDINRLQLATFLNPSLQIPFGKSRASLDVGLIASLQLNNNYNYPYDARHFYLGLRLASLIRLSR